MTLGRITEIQRLLRARAYDRREEFGAVLTWFMAEGLALRLGKHAEVRGQLLLTGDLMLHALLGSSAPFEWEVELLAIGAVTAAELARRLREVCDVEVDDGLDLELPHGGVSEPALTADGRCATASLVGRLGSITLPLQVVVRLDAQFHEVPSDYFFGSVLGNSLCARVLACPPNTAVALLLRAGVEKGVAPSGLRELWHLYRLIESGKVDPCLASAAVVATFQDRGAPIPRSVPLLLSEEFAADASRQQVWEAFLRRARVSAPILQEVVMRVQHMVWPWLLQAAAGRPS